MNAVKISSGSKTGSAVISAVACDFCGIIIALDGSSAVTLNVYDNATEASGDKLIPTLVIPTSATIRVFNLDLIDGVRAMNGVYIDVSVSGQGSCAYVAYTRKGKAG